MQSKAITQSGTTAPAGVMTLDESALGWNPAKYAQHQIQVSGLASANTATLQTRAPSAGASNWADVQQLVGDGSTNHMIVLTPESGRHAALRVVFSNTSGTCEVAFGSHMSASGKFVR